MAPQFVCFCCCFVVCVFPADWCVGKCGVSHAAATHTVELCGSWCSVTGNVSGVSVHASVVVLCVLFVW